LAINLGFSVGPAVGGFVALYLGYRWLFVIDACTSFAAAAMLFFYLPRPADRARRSNNDILGDKSMSAYRDIRYLFFILMVTLYAVCFFQMFVSLPQYFSKICNYNEDTIGLLLAFNGLLVVIIEMPLIAALEKKKRIFPFIISGSFCIPFAFAAVLFGQGMMLWALVYILIITFSEIFAMPFMMNYALSRPRKERQGQYSALYSMAYGIAMIAAPLLGLGIAGKYGFEIMFYFFMTIGTVAGLGFIFLNKRTTV
jgi:predicted MFS family arabinose efflux permease